MVMKNIVVMPNFKEPSTKEDALFIKNSKILWTEWCKKFGYDLVIIEEPICPFNKLCPQMQKMWVMEILDDNGIEYDQILAVDHDTYPIPNCPDVFQMTNGEFTAALDNGFGPQLNRQMIIFREHYFPNDKFVTWDTYFNSGFIIYSKKHKEVFKRTQKFYFDNIKEFEIINKDGMNDQTPINYILADMGFKLTVLPRSFNVLDFHMERFLIPTYVDERGREVNREKNIIDCINVFHIGNGHIRDAASEYLMKIIWKL